MSVFGSFVPTQRERWLNAIRFTAEQGPTGPVLWQVNLTFNSQCYLKERSNVVGTDNTLLTDFLTNLVTRSTATIVHRSVTIKPIIRTFYAIYVSSYISIPQKRFGSDQEVDNPLVSLLLMGSSSYGDNLRCRNDNDPHANFLWVAAAEQNTRRPLVASINHSLVAYRTRLANSFTSQLGFFYHRKPRKFGFSETEKKSLI